jgi:putative RecB family exonuclease
MFENCPLQYKFNYIDKIKREEESIEAFLGLRFHEVMEKLYQDLRFRVYTLEELLSYYEDQWSKNYHENILIIRKERTADDYKNLGRKCIEDYYRRYHPFNQRRVLAIEKRIEIDLQGDRKYLVQGYIDRIDQKDEGTYEIHDYKTSGSLPEQSYLDQDRQLALYQIGIQNIWRDVDKVKLVWHYVTFDKEMSSTRTKEELEILKENIIALINEIENTEEFLPKESALCNWCAYADLCPKQKHSYSVNKLSVNKYLDDDGVKLVNTYAQLDFQKKEYNEKIKEIENELDEIKEAVIKYAEDEGLDIIIGSDHQLKISEKQKVSFPAKNSEGRKTLEEILRKLNKLEEVSTLDFYAFEKKIKNREWDYNTLEKIKDFYKEEVIKSVSVSKKK